MSGAGPWVVSDWKISRSVSHFLVFLINPGEVSGFAVEVTCPGHISNKRGCYAGVGVGVGGFSPLLLPGGDNTVAKLKTDGANPSNK